jgi:hypothetical protein
MKTGDKDIDPHIKLIAINKEGVGNILLHNNIIQIIKIAQRVNQLNAPAPALPNRLHNPIVLVPINQLLLMKPFRKLGEFFGQVEG